MKFQETRLSGAFLIDVERHEDERGFFARTWCQEEMESHGLNTSFVQCNISFNHRKGTLRGMHYQAPPSEEAKLVRCTQGVIYDVIVDLRSGSPTYLEWEAFELSAENRYQLFIPEGLAHGFQTLEDDSEVFYQMSEFYAPELARGLRWNDPAISIEWPLTPSCISEKDSALPLLNTEKETPC